MGIKGAELRPEQQKILQYLIEEYMNNMKKEKAEEYLADGRQKPSVFQIKENSYSLMIFTSLKR
jgi:hypothetical protein